MRGAHVLSRRANAGMGLFFVSLFFSTSAVAEPPQTPMLVAELMMLPTAAFFMALGGAHAVRRAKGNEIRWWLMGVAVLTILLSTRHEAAALYVTYIFSLVTMTRAFQLIYWVLRASLGSVRLKELESVKPLRMALSGTALAIVTIFLFGLAFVSYRNYPSQRESALSQAQDFVSWQLANATGGDTLEGGKRFAHLIVDRPAYGTRMEIEYSNDFSGFVIHSMSHQLMPFWPYNYLLDQWAYRGDETGTIREMRVVRGDERCPPDGAVIWTAPPEEISKARGRVPPHRIKPAPE